MQEGSQRLDMTDFVVNDINTTFRIERSYESVYTNKGGILGSKWYLNIESKVYVNNDKIDITMPEMYIKKFTKNKDTNSWESNDGLKDFILYEEEGSYILKNMLDKSKYIYNTSGDLECIKDKNNIITKFIYEGKLLSKIEFNSKQFLEFSYKNGKLYEITDVLERIIRYSYDGEYLTEVKYADDGKVKYTYTENGNIETVTDQNEHTYVHNYYDYANRVIKQTLSTGQEYIARYDTRNKVNTFITKSNKNIEKYYYNSNNIITKIEYQDETTDLFEYDKYNNKIYEKGRNENETFTEYNEYGNITKQKYANGYSINYEYNKEQNLIKIYDNLRKDIELSYDKNGNNISICLNGNKPYYYEYDEYGRNIKIINPKDNETKIEYGKRAKDPEYIEYPVGNTFKNEYDEAGRMVVSRNMYGKYKYGHSHMDCVTRVCDEYENHTMYDYDNLCNLIQIVTANNRHSGIRTMIKYDSMDNQTHIIDEYENTYITRRNEEGSIIKEITPTLYNSYYDDGDGIHHIYDEYERRIKTIYPDGAISRTFYDAKGNIVKRILPEQYDENTDSGAGYIYKYDNMDNLVQIIAPNGDVQMTYEYDLYGNVIKTIDANGYLTGKNNTDRIGTIFEYNEKDLIITKRLPTEIVDNKAMYKVIKYEYDEMENKVEELHYIEMQTNSSLDGDYHKILFEYDRNDRLRFVKDSIGAVMEYQYDAINSLMYEKRRINSKVEQAFYYRYDKIGRVIDVSPEIKKGNLNTRYEYDRNGNVTRIILPTKAEIIRKYDLADRLIVETHKDKTGIDNTTKFYYNASSDIKKIEDNDGNCIKIEYDVLNRVIRKIDQNVYLR